MWDRKVCFVCVVTAVTVTRWILTTAARSVSYVIVSCWRHVAEFAGKFGLLLRLACAGTSAMPRLINMSIKKLLVLVKHETAAWEEDD